MLKSNFEIGVSLLLLAASKLEEKKNGSETWDEFHEVYITHPIPDF